MSPLHQHFRRDPDDGGAEVHSEARAGQEEVPGYVEAEEMDEIKGKAEGWKRTGPKTAKSICERILTVPEYAPRGERLKGRAADFRHAELGRLIVGQHVKRLLRQPSPSDSLCPCALTPRRLIRCSQTRPAPPSSMTCCLAARNHMTGRGPCSAMRMSICE